MIKSNSTTFPSSREEELDLYITYISMRGAYYKINHQNIWVFARWQLDKDNSFKISKNTYLEYILYFAQVKRTRNCMFFHCGCISSFIKYWLGEVHHAARFFPENSACAWERTIRKTKYICAFSIYIIAGCFGFFEMFLQMLSSARQKNVTDHIERHVRSTNVWNGLHITV